MNRAGENTGLVLLAGKGSQGVPGGGADTLARVFPGGGEVVSHTSPITSTLHSVPWSPAVSQKVSFETTFPDPAEKNE